MSHMLICDSCPNKKVDVNVLHYGFCLKIQRICCEVEPQTRSDVFFDVWIIFILHFLILLHSSCLNSKFFYILDERLVISCLKGFCSNVFSSGGAFNYKPYQMWPKFGCTKRKSAKN